MEVRSDEEGLVEERWMVQIGHKWRLTGDGGILGLFLASLFSLDERGDEAIYRNGLGEFCREN